MYKYYVTYELNGTVYGTAIEAESAIRARAKFLASHSRECSVLKIAGGPSDQFVHVYRTAKPRFTLAEKMLIAGTIAVLGLTFNPIVIESNHDQRREQHA